MDCWSQVLLFPLLCHCHSFTFLKPSQPFKSHHICLYFPIPIADLTASHAIRERNFVRPNGSRHVKECFFHVSGLVTQQKASLVDLCQSHRLPHSWSINTRGFFSPYINRKNYFVQPRASNRGVHCTKHSPYGTNQIGLTISFLKYSIFIKFF